MSMVSVLKFNLFGRKNGKWHEVRWRSGPRHVYLALRFAPDGAGSAAAPTIERLPAENGAGAAAAEGTNGDKQGTTDEAQIILAVQAAVAEYNRMNLCALRVAGIRYRAGGGAEPLDHGTATRKLLNLL